MSNEVEIKCKIGTNKRQQFLARIDFIEEGTVSESYILGPYKTRELAVEMSDIEFNFIMEDMKQMFPDAKVKEDIQ